MDKFFIRLRSALILDYALQYCLKKLHNKQSRAETLLLEIIFVLFLCNLFLKKSCFQSSISHLIKIFLNIIGKRKQKKLSFRFFLSSA